MGEAKVVSKTPERVQQSGASEVAPEARDGVPSLEASGMGAD